MNDKNQEAQAILLLERACFDQPWSANSIRTQLEKCDTVYHITYVDNAPAGFVMGEIIAGEAELYRIAVRAECRGQGTGSFLLREFLRLCGKKGCARVFLEVRSRNQPARALYEKAGFRQIGLRKDYYGDDDAVLYAVEA